MNAQQSRIRAILERLVDEGAVSDKEVDLVDQTELASLGYPLCQLTPDLIHISEAGRAVD